MINISEAEIHHDEHMTEDIENETWFYMVNHCEGTGNRK